MLVDLLTLFPEWFASPLKTALLGKALAAGLVDVRLHNPRDLTTDRHHTTDDRPYGGGPGMIMLAEPLLRTLARVHAPGARTLLLSASGLPFTQAFARELAAERHLILVCGRYEGVDARLEALFPVEPVSLGDVVLNGGEAAAMMLLEAVTRLIPGFMGKKASSEQESFAPGTDILEHPHYTRPQTCAGFAVPPVLLSGDHARIARYRREQSLLTTGRHRPDLLDNAPLAAEDLRFLRGPALAGMTHAGGRERLGRNLYLALAHHPVVLEKNGRGEKIGTSSLTNLDVHDIARCSRTYGLGGYYLVSPLDDQLRLLEILREHWTTGAGGRTNPDRAEALSLVRGVGTLDEAVEAIARHAGQHPLLVATSARQPEGRARSLVLHSAAALRKILRHRPVLLVFGTAQGLAPELLARCDALARPLRWLDSYNHLPVRGAAAILLDRILGDRY
jgi:tRNA (guanine37-N1)-methyltransferase